MTNPGLRLSLKILSLLADRPRTFGELSRKLGQPSAATLSRNMKVLIEEEWIVKGEDQLYHEGKELARSACSFLSRKTGTPQLQPLVEQLALDSGESAAFARWQGEGIIFTAKKEMPESFHYIPLNEVNRNNSYNAFNIVCLAYQKNGEALAAAPPPLGSIFKESGEITETFKAIKRDAIFQCLDTVLRFTAPVFYNAQTVDQKIFAGVLGISLIPRELAEKEAEKYKELVKKAAAKAGQLLLF